MSGLTGGHEPVSGGRGRRRRGRVLGGAGLAAAPGDRRTCASTTGWSTSWCGERQHRFDLTNAATELELVGTPGERDWQVLFLRRGLDPVAVDARMVDGDAFTEALRAWRPGALGSAAGAGTSSGPAAPATTSADVCPGSRRTRP